MPPRKPTRFELLLEERDLLRKQIDWLCNEIPKIGTLVEPKDGRPVETALDMDEYVCPSPSLYKTCRKQSASLHQDSGLALMLQCSLSL